MIGSARYITNTTMKVQNVDAGFTVFDSCHRLDSLAHAAKDSGLAER
jgi:hypothetical protein